MTISTTGDLSRRSGRSERQVRLRSWRKVCAPTPPRRLSRCLFGALFLPLALSGCGLMRPRVEQRFVLVTCVTHQQFDQLRAAEPERVHSRLSGDAEHDSKILAGSNVRLRSYADGLLEVIGGCAEPDPHRIADQLLNDSSK